MTEKYHELLIEIVDIYASEYGWTRDYILENVYIDEYFKQRELIDKRKRQHYLMLAHIQLLPHSEQKSRKNFFDKLTETENHSTIVNKHVETDLEALKKAKEQLKRMS